MFASDIDASKIDSIILHDEVAPHTEIPGSFARETLTLEIDYGKGKWKKIKRRWKKGFTREELSEMGIEIPEEFAENELAGLRDSWHNQGTVGADADGNELGMA